MNRKKAPILLITFNRPTHTKRVLESVATYRPDTLFVFQDGARVGHATDVVRCAEVRQVIEQSVNWPCTIHRYYADENRGCGKGPSSAISWFFEQVEAGIVMEDDCVPHDDFYRYCETLLLRYKEDSKVMFIGGTIYSDTWHCDASYAFSHYIFVGAWASWRRAWQGYDFDLKKLDRRRFKLSCQHLFYSASETDWWVEKCDEIINDTSVKSYWDYQMQIHLIVKEGVSLNPRFNMVQNIGFDLEGTHTVNNACGLGYRTIQTCLPMQHPQSDIVDKKLDYECFAKEYYARNWDYYKVWLYKRLQRHSILGKQMILIYKRIKTASHI